MTQTKAQAYGCVSKSELAMRYFPGVQPHTAVNRLMSWIKADEQVYQELKSCGYRDRQKLLSPKMVRIIERIFI